MDAHPANDTNLGAEPSPEKKAYAAPVLLEWGTLRDLTLAVGNRGRSDGGKKSGQKRTRA
jgi:hypothetical protein